MWRMLNNAAIFDGEEEDEENTDKMKQGSAKCGKMKRTVFRKNLTSTMMP